MKEQFKNLIKKTAIQTAEKTVGKSLPIFAYEVEVPEVLKKKYTESK